MEKEKKRNISAITVMLFILLIITMMTITINSINKNNLLESTDKSVGLTVTDFTLTNVTTGEEKSSMIPIERGEYVQLKVYLSYTGESLNVGDKLSFDMKDNLDYNSRVFYWGSITTDTPIYDNNGVELGTYKLSNNNFIITMTRSVDSFNDIAIVTSNNFIFRHRNKVVLIDDVLETVTIGNLEKSFLLQKEELVKVKGNKVGVVYNSVSNNSVLWDTSGNNDVILDNAYEGNDQFVTFKNCVIETTFTNVVEPIKADDIRISLRWAIPATACDGFAGQFTYGDIEKYFKKVYPNEGESYDDFKLRVIEEGVWSFGVYEVSDSEYILVVYKGNLEDTPYTYEEMVKMLFGVNDLAEILEMSGMIIGGTTEEMKEFFRQEFSTSNLYGGKIASFVTFTGVTYEEVTSPTDMSVTAKLTDDSGIHTISRVATLTPNYGMGSATTFNPIKKVWNDDENSKGLRPENAVVSVYQNGMLYKTLTLTKKDQVSANRWEQTIEDLPQYDENGNQYLYTAKEEKVVLSNGDEYFPSILGSTITNTLRGIVKYEVEKKWEDNNNEAGKRPEEVEIILKANGEEVRRQKLTEETNWKYTFTNLDKYDSNGKEITYTVDEEFTSEFYVKTIVGNVITNTFVVPEDKIKITGTKVWYDLEDFAGKRPESVVLQVKAEGVVVSEAVVNEENHWSYEFELAKYDRLGKEIEYVIDEKETSKFYEKELTDNKTVTNKFVVPDEKVKLKVEKVWEDQNDKYQKRPKSVTLQVKAGEKIVDEIEVSEKENWSYEFELPKYDELGNEIEYSIDEKETNQYYEKRIEKNKIINTCTYKEEVNTSDINVWIYVIITIVAIMGIIVGIVIMSNGRKTNKMVSKK
ncbi:MAG: Cna B-type domain-containing protein [Clostridia bacterium]|nr:Cna B-type domain-containing protein [Clostridia bacterium]